MASEVELKGRLLNWVETEAQFETADPVLKSGEQVVILDPIRKKIGNGISAYNELPFDTNHNLIPVAEASTLTLYNTIPQTTFFLKRSNPATTDVIFLLDSYKDSHRQFFQCDGRIHKIFVQNYLTSTFEIELALTSAENTEASSLVDIGTVTIAAQSFAIIEFAWFKNRNDKKICFSRIQVSSNIVQDISFISSYFQNTTGTFNLYNENRRQYNVYDVNNSASTILIYISHLNSVGVAPTSKMEHYCLIKNTNAATRTVAIMLFTSGHKVISEGLSSISLASGKAFEFSYIFLTRGTDTVCVITKSNILTEITN